MNRPDGHLKRGSLIVTHATLGDSDGMLVGPKHVAQRRASAEGRLCGPIAGHRGGAYYVNHRDASGHRAAYRVDEIEMVAEPALTEQAVTTRIDARKGSSKPRELLEEPSIIAFARGLRARIEGYFAAHPTVVEGEAAR